MTIVPPPPIPPLQDGQRLKWDEFARRWDAMPELKKAELLEGVVYMSPSPVNHDFHGEPHAAALQWLGIYRIFTPGTRRGDNSTIRLDDDNAPQPDGLLFIDPAYGGQVRFDENRYVVGAPELAVEVSASRAHIDLGTRLQVFLRFGVIEYLVWRTYDQALDWFLLRDGQDVRLEAGEDGIQRSPTFPGLWLNTPALMAGDEVAVFQTLQAGLASPEHTQFVRKLQEARARQGGPTP